MVKIKEESTFVFLFILFKEGWFIASINGLSLRNIREWEGREGPACQGDLYLGETKICFWSQDGNGGMDTYDFEREFSEANFNKVINELYKDKYFTYTFGKEESKIKYDSDLLMLDIVELQEMEKEYDKFYAKGAKGLVAVKNWGYQMLIPLSFSDVLLSDEALKEKLSSKIDDFTNEHGKENLRVDIYRYKKDFCKGKEINISDLYAEKTHSNHIEDNELDLDER